jgi:hypothetical protein
MFFLIPSRDPFLRRHEDEESSFPLELDIINGIRNCVAKNRDTLLLSLASFVGGIYISYSYSRGSLQTETQFLLEAFECKLLILFELLLMFFHLTDCKRCRSVQIGIYH